jgi:FMN phosphatase YigB (HAD superfamily)
LTVNWRQVELVIFDVDGTLYGQSGLRRRMAFELAKHAIQGMDFSTPIILREFRKIREVLAIQNSRSFTSDQYLLTAKSCRCTPEMVRDVVSTWIEGKPLDFIRGYRIAGIEQVFAALRRQGRKIAILSDYPVEKKLAALGLSADLPVSAEDHDVLALKPNPAGIVKILRQASVSNQSALMIGDRFETDWKAAKAAGIDCLIRSRHPDPRAYTFRDYHDPCFKPLVEMGS